MRDEFDDAYFTQLADARHHWWVVGMLDIGRRVLGPVRTPVRALDAGCGTGVNFEWLRALSGGALTAIDFSGDAMAFCRHLESAVDLAQASITAMPFAAGSFDLVVSSDVLQHLGTEDVRSALREVHRVLRPGGQFLARTNAAFGRARIAERADWRLYRPSTLRAELEEAGLRVERLSYANSLPALASVVRDTATRWRSAGAGHDEARHQGHHDDEGGLGIPAPEGGLRSRVLGRTLAFEARWLARPGRSLPFGHALVAVARRPAS